MGDMEKRGGMYGVSKPLGHLGRRQEWYRRMEAAGAASVLGSCPSVTALPFLGLDFLDYEMGMLTGKAEWEKDTRSTLMLAALLLREPGCLPSPPPPGAPAGKCPRASGGRDGWGLGTC